MWNGKVGWFATMAQDPPEPPMVVPLCTLAKDMRRILEDTSTSDVTFLVGNHREPICAHRSIIKARCDFFNALLSGKLCLRLVFMESIFVTADISFF